MLLRYTTRGITIGLAVVCALLQPTTARDLGSRFDDTIAESGKGGNLDVTAALPGGDVVSGTFTSVTGTADINTKGPIGLVDLARSGLEAPADWNASIDEFVNQFGGDRQEITDVLAENFDGIRAAEQYAWKYFQGDDHNGYVPSLGVRVNSDSVDVHWSFTLIY